jgi:hypothetical protein
LECILRSLFARALTLTLLKLIWVKVDDLPGNPPITYWPAIVTERSVRSEAKLIQRNEPPTPPAIEMTEYYVWQVSLLGVFDKTRVRESRLLPWLAYRPPPELFDIPLTNDEPIVFLSDRVRAALCDRLRALLTHARADVPKSQTPSAQRVQDGSTGLVYSFEVMSSSFPIRMHRPSHLSRSPCRSPIT